MCSLSSIDVLVQDTYLILITKKKQKLNFGLDDILTCLGFYDILTCLGFYDVLTCLDDFDLDFKITILYFLI